MKVAVLSESPADQAAVHVLVDALVGQPTKRRARPYRVHGWSTVFGLLPTVLKELHFNTDVEALAVVVDSDRTPVHVAAHDQLPEDSCRLCRLRQVVRNTQSGLKTTGRPAVRVAVGLAVPCIEAWLRCGHDPAVTEAAWLTALAESRFPYDARRLKRDVYGSDRPSLDLETRRMTEEATRLAGNVQLLETWFPNGFGPFATEVRGWRPA